MPRSLCSTQAALAAGLRLSAGTPFAATMRPRSIGTRSSVAPGALRRMASSNRPPSAGGMSRKKNAGARSGSAAMNCRRRLPSISTTVTRRASPNPSDSTTLVVSAPGRYTLAMARRSTVERACGRRARDPHQAARRSGAAPPAPRRPPPRRLRRCADHGRAPPRAPPALPPPRRSPRCRSGAASWCRPRPRRGTRSRPARPGRVRAATARTRPR